MRFQRIAEDFREFFDDFLERFDHFPKKIGTLLQKQKNRLPMQKCPSFSDFCFCKMIEKGDLGCHVLFCIFSFCI